MALRLRHFSADEAPNHWSARAGDHQGDVSPPPVALSGRIFAHGSLAQSVKIAPANNLARKAYTFRQHFF
jgi:hypothetical protein